MMDRQYGNVVFTCDTCGDDYETDTKDFNEAWAEARSAGWVAFEISGDWHHHCEDCDGRNS